MKLAIRVTKDLNLAGILKDCPVGMSLYSPLFGYVWFKGIRNAVNGVMIDVGVLDHGTHSFHADGRYFSVFSNTEVLLFPDKDQRDWSKFKVAKPKLDIATLKPFDKVLMRSSNSMKWMITHYSHKEDRHFVGCGLYGKQCIPYEGNEHLLGTIDECDEYYKTW